MEQEQTYAQLLEIPVESCTVITKKSKKRTYKRKEERLKSQAIARVNAGAEEDFEGQTPPTFEGNFEGQAEEFAPPEIPQRFAPVGAIGAEAQGETYAPPAAAEDAPLTLLEGEESILPVCEIMEELPAPSMAESLPTPKKRGVLTIAITAVCALLSVAFLLNALVFRVDISGAMQGQKRSADTRLRDSFSLSLPTLGAYEIEGGVLRFSGKGGVYATEDGIVSALSQGEDGLYTMEISHSDLFKTVISGVSTPFNQMGERVFRAQPVAYGTGERISVSFYEKGEMLSCAVEEGTVKV